MKKICVEIDGVLYESCRYIGKIIGCSPVTIKNRCLSDKFPNYKIVPFRITYTKKKCITCGKIKLLKEFGKQSGNKDKLKNECKKCIKKYKKEWDKNNPDYYKIYSQNNKEKANKRSKEWNEENTDRRKIYNQNRKEKRKKYTKKKCVKNKRNQQLKERRKTDIVFRLNTDMGTNIRASLKGMKNGAPWESLSGYTCEELKAHLESKFTEGMSWDNYGKGKYKWNLDHVKAKSKFNITSSTCQEFLDCWVLKNLQPLWQIRNFEKGNKPMHPKYLIKPDNIK